MLMQYMEHSTQDNARTAGLKRLHKMVTEVKADREVGLAYMKSYEIERRIRTQARTEGKAESVLILLEDFGEIPEELKNRIFSEKNQTVLDGWLHAAKRADSLADFMDEAGITL